MRTFEALEKLKPHSRLESEIMQAQSRSRDGQNWKPHRGKFVELGLRFAYCWTQFMCLSTAGPLGRADQGRGGRTARVGPAFLRNSQRAEPPQALLLRGGKLHRSLTSSLAPVPRLGISPVCSFTSAFHRALKVLNDRCQGMDAPPLEFGTRFARVRWTEHIQVGWRAWRKELTSGSRQLQPYSMFVTASVYMVWN
jgi:hypothetical protein